MTGNKDKLPYSRTHKVNQSVIYVRDVHLHQPRRLVTGINIISDVNLGVNHRTIRTATSLPSAKNGNKLRMKNPTRIVFITDGEPTSPEV